MYGTWCEIEAQTRDAYQDSARALPQDEWAASDNHIYTLNHMVNNGVLASSSIMKQGDKNNEMGPRTTTAAAAAAPPTQF